MCRAGRPETRTPEELVAALRAASGNVSLAAGRLGMSRRALYYAADRHQLPLEQHRAWARWQAKLEKFFGRGHVPPAFSCPACGKLHKLTDLLTALEELRSGAGIVWQCPNCRRLHALGTRRH